MNGQLDREKNRNKRYAHKLLVTKKKTRPLGSRWKNERLHLEWPSLNKRGMAEDAGRRLQLAERDDERQATSASDDTVCREPISE